MDGGGEEVEGRLDETKIRNRTGADRASGDDERREEDRKEGKRSCMVLLQLPKHIPGNRPQTRNTYASTGPHCTKKQNAQPFGDSQKWPVNWCVHDRTPAHQVGLVACDHGG